MRYKALLSCCDVLSYQKFLIEISSIVNNSPKMLMPFNFFRFPYPSVTSLFIQSFLLFIHNQNLYTIFIIFTAFQNFPQSYKSPPSFSGHSSESSCIIIPSKVEHFLFYLLYYMPETKLVIIYCLALLLFLIKPLFLLHSLFLHCL